MRLPPFGLSLPCRFRRCRDGDTVEVSLPGSDRIWAIRLLGCSCPELCEPGGAEAKGAAEAALDAADHLAVFIPAPKDPVRLLRSILTFDRVLGHVFLDTETTLSDILVRGGFGTKEPQAARQSSIKMESL